MPCHRYTQTNFLSGKLWKQGYSSGEITTPLYPDVLPALETWLAIPKTLAIFSSGSVEAQLNFFKYIDIPPPAATPAKTNESDDHVDGDAENDDTGATPNTTAVSEGEVDSRKRQRSSPDEQSPTDLPPSPSSKKTKPTTSDLQPSSDILPTPKTRDLNPLFTAKFDTVTAGSNVLVQDGFLCALRDPEVVEMASLYGDPFQLLEAGVD